MAFRYEAEERWRATNQCGGISGWADKQTDGDGEAAHRGFTKSKGENSAVCVSVQKCLL